ncbi:hypothetical protein [Streptomyces sp. NPDC003720]|uniref:hypothetical protein n=1 Tax=Streptomyces sp. NPDC003720 TaxID=3364684 RepID=UPI0036B8BDAA
MELRLAPGTVLPLLGVPAAALVGRAVPLEELPGDPPRRLASALRRLDPREAAGRLAAELPALLRAGVGALSVRLDRGPARVREVARELAVSTPGLPARPAPRRRAVAVPAPCPKNPMSGEGAVEVGGPQGSRPAAAGGRTPHALPAPAS